MNTRDQVEALLVALFHIRMETRINSKVAARNKVPLKMAAHIKQARNTETINMVAHPKAVIRHNMETISMVVLSKVAISHNMVAHPEAVIRHQQETINMLAHPKAVIRHQLGTINMVAHPKVAISHNKEIINTVAHSKAVISHKMAIINRAVSHQPETANKVALSLTKQIMALVQVVTILELIILLQKGNMSINRDLMGLDLILISMLLARRVMLENSVFFYRYFRINSI